jgi:hypothetical protein
MKGAFWNIRGLNQSGRNLSLAHLIKENHLDFVGIHETKKEMFLLSFLNFLSCPVNFTWHFLPAGGIFVGFKDENLTICNVSILKSSISCMVMDKSKNFSWKLVVVYGSPYEDGKVEFIDELHLVMAAWKGPVMIGGDFNLSRFVSDKSNGRINKKWADCFND